MARKGMEVTTTVTFQVTFKLPKGIKIPTARACIREALMSPNMSALQLNDEKDIRVHLTNKEMKYGKR